MQDLRVHFPFMSKMLRFSAISFDMTADELLLAYGCFIWKRNMIRGVNSKNTRMVKQAFVTFF